MGFPNDRHASSDKLVLIKRINLLYCRWLKMAKENLLAWLTEIKDQMLGWKKGP